MPYSRSTNFSRNRKKKRWETNNNRTQRHSCNNWHVNNNTSAEELLELVIRNNSLGLGWLGEGRGGAEEGGGERGNGAELNLILFD